MLLVVVVASIDPDTADTEKGAQFAKAGQTSRALHHDKPMHHLPPGLVATTAHPIWLPDEAD
jgi:hypothetical protein